MQFLKIFYIFYMFFVKSILILRFHNFFILHITIDTIKILIGQVLWKDYYCRSKELMIILYGKETHMFD